MENPLSFVKSSQEIHIAQLSQGPNENIIHPVLLNANRKLSLDFHYKYKKIPYLTIYSSKIIIRGSE